MIKRLVPWVVGLAIVAVGIAWWRRSNGNGAVALVFRTAAVQRGDVTQTVTGSGTLSALTTVEVGSQVSGNVAKLYVDYNDPVTSGQLLAEIEPTTYESKLFQADADLLAAQAALELKDISIRRAKDLLAKQLISQSDYDDAVAAFKQQEASTKKAEAAVKSAKTDLERCKINSPVDGVVLTRSVSVGQTVQSNFSVATLFTIARDLRQMEIEAAISEADIGGVEAGQTVTFTVDAFPSRTFQAKVRQIRNNSTVSNNVVTYPVIISVDNTDLKLRPGMTANVVIATARRTNVLRVPNAALRFKPPETAVVTAASSGEPLRLEDLPGEVRQRIIAEFDKNGDGKLDADEKKAMDAAMQGGKVAGPGTGGSGPPDGGPGGLPPAGGNAAGRSGATARPGALPTSSGTGSRPVTVYLAAGDALTAGRASGALRAANVYVGVSDSSNTEILSGLGTDDVVVTGVLSAAAATATSGTNNLFGPPKPPGANKK